MQTKLTLRMDDALIERAKAWARANNTSLSETVAQVFSQLPTLPQPGEEPDLSKLSPWVRRLAGAARIPGKPPPTDKQVREDYIDYLERKYR